MMTTQQPKKLLRLNKMFFEGLYTCANTYRRKHKLTLKTK